METPKLILVIEDDPTFRMLLEQALTLWGYRVIGCEDGEEGVREYAQHMHEVHVVILDMIMPKKGGQETFSEIRAMNPEAKIILISGYTGENDITFLLRNGAKGFFSKPFDASDLFILLRSL